MEFDNKLWKFQIDWRKLSEKNQEFHTSLFFTQRKYQILNLFYADLGLNSSAIKYS